MLDQFTVDSRIHGGASSGAASAISLALGVPYSVTVDGNYTVWGGDLFGSHPPVKYNSPGESTREAAMDADTRWADELLPASPAHALSTFLFSTNGGASFVHVEPIGGPFSSPQPGHVYSYTIVGGGLPLRARISDSPLSDNNGLLVVTIEEAITAAGWSVGFIG